MLVANFAKRDDANGIPKRLTYKGANRMGPNVSISIDRDGNSALRRLLGNRPQGEVTLTVEQV